MRDPHDADGGARPGDSEGGRNGLLGPDALERRVGADAAGELQHSLAGFLAAGLDDVRGSELTGHPLSAGMAAQCDDALAKDSLTSAVFLLPQLQATTGWPTRGGPAVRGTGRTPFASGPHQPGMRPGGQLPVSRIRALTR